MQYTTLGKTGLRVSVAGLGCGGDAQLGLGRGKSEDEAVALVRSALDLGVNFFDTSEAYLTEGVLGRAVAEVSRDDVVLCTKSRYRDMRSGDLHPVETVIANLDRSLERMGVDYTDAFLIHGVMPQHYEHVRDVIVPALLREKEKGKLRHIGLSEFPAMDPEHKAVRRALDDDVWEIMMFGFHMLHQGPSRTIFPQTRAKGIGTAIMYAVRSIFSRPGAVEAALKEAADNGEIPHELATADALDFLIHDGGAASLTDAAYRFARHEPGADVILFGTGDQGHLRANVESLLRPALPEADLKRLRETFASLRSAGLDVPDALKAQMKK